MNRIPCNTSFNIRWWLKSKCTWMYRSVRKLTLLISLLCVRLWQLPEIFMKYDLMQYIYGSLSFRVVFFKKSCIIVTFLLITSIGVLVLLSFTICSRLEYMQTMKGYRMTNVFFFIRTTEGCRISRHKQNEKLLHCQFLSD